MTDKSQILSISIDGMWMPMELARLLHIVVRVYRLEQIVHMAESGGRNFFEDRLDAVVLKHLAAFDWIAAPLMSTKFNDSFARSEDFVRTFGLSDPRIHRISYGTDGCIEFSGHAPIITKAFGIFDDLMAIRRSSPARGSDGHGRFANIDVLYASNIRAKANVMKDTSYSDAQLHAVISPSIEDLHFVSNAMAQGKIVAVESKLVSG